LEYDLTVFKLDDAVADLSREDAVQYLLVEAESSSNGTARICFHQSDTAALQLMLIAVAPGRSFPLHLHKKKNEFLVHMAGSGALELSEGDKSRTVALDESTRESGVVFPPKWAWHSVSAGPKGLVFLEFSQGPFDPDDTVFAQVHNQQ